MLRHVMSCHALPYAASAGGRLALDAHACKVARSKRFMKRVKRTVFSQQKHLKLLKSGR